MHAGLARDHDGAAPGVASGMVAIEVMSPARPRSSSSARMHGLVDRERRQEGVGIEQGGRRDHAYSVRRSSVARCAARCAARRRDLARLGERRHGALRQRGHFGRIVGAEMRRRGFRARSRRRPRPAAPRSPCCAARCCAASRSMRGELRDARRQVRRRRGSRRHARVIIVRRRRFARRHRRPSRDVDQRVGERGRRGGCAWPAMSSAMRAAKTTASSSEFEARRLAPCAPVEATSPAGPQAVERGAAVRVHRDAAHVIVRGRRDRDRLRRRIDAGRDGRLA